MPCGHPFREGGVPQTAATGTHNKFYECKVCISDLTSLLLSCVFILELFLCALDNLVALVIWSTKANASWKTVRNIFSWVPYSFEMFTE